MKKKAIKNLWPKFKKKKNFYCLFFIIIFYKIKKICFLKVVKSLLKIKKKKFLNECSKAEAGDRFLVK